MKTSKVKSISGFTIIELMIVLVVLAVLLALAYPSYIDYARKAKRGEAQQLLMNYAINQEIWRSNNPIYDHFTDGNVPVPTHDHYTFASSENMTTPATCTGPGGRPDAGSYWLRALASGDQLNDTARDGTSCATLCLQQTGRKEPAACWD